MPLNLARVSNLWVQPLDTRVKCSQHCLICKGKRYIIGINSILLKPYATATDELTEVCHIEVK